jgi:hypothetical protein
MDTKLLLLFITLNIINVIVQTIKSIVTIKCGKAVAAVINAVAYGFYTVVVVYMTDEGLPLFTKAFVIGAVNLIGVYIVKLFEEKMRKDKLWKVEATLKPQQVKANNHSCIKELKENNISCNYIEIENYVIVNCYCSTQQESTKVKQILNKYNAKYFVSETKTL